MYGKLNNGIIEYAPSRIELDGCYIFNPTNEQLKQLGYKEIKDGEMPEMKDGFHYAINYEEADDTITCIYTLVADEHIDSENTIEARLSALEASQEEQNATIDTLIFSGLE